MKSIIIVDDQDDDGTALAETLSYTIDLMTSGQVSLVCLTGRIISDSFAEVKAEAGKILKQNDRELAGFLLDLVDRRDKEGGLKLCKEITSDKALKQYPVLIYTSKYTMTAPSDAKRCGAKGFVKRDEYNHVTLLSGAILNEFGLDHLVTKR